MNLYIYANLLQDPVVQNLLAWRESHDIAYYYAACGGLLNARSGVREYIAARLLEETPPCGLTRIEAYFDHDVRAIYESLLAYDWDADCQQNDVLGLPAFPEAAGDSTELRKTLAGLVSAPSAEVWGGALKEFFSRYAMADEAKYAAFKWAGGALVGIAAADDISFDDLGALGYRKAALIDNTAAFVHHRPALDVLLAGAAGTGKSSCVKAVFNRFRPEGLKLIELFKDDIAELPLVMEEIKKRKQQYIVFIDDLSFEGPDADYKALKVALDGQIEKRPGNMLLYATSNRIHLVRETWQDRAGDEDVRENDTIQEKMSLSERFGLRIRFQVLSQPEYFEIVAMLLQKYGVAFNEDVGKQAAAWALEQGGRSGRAAKQFVTEFLNR